MKNLGLQLNAIALSLSAAGLLLVFEVIRPFRDLAKDGPLALFAWAIGTALVTRCLFLKERSLAVTLVAAAANVLPLLGAVALWLLLRKSSFAWH